MRKLFNTCFLLFKSFWLSILWGVIITLSSLLSADNVGKISVFKFQHADKFAHFGLYFIFSYFIMIGFKNIYISDIIKFKKQAITYAILISIIFGGIMEFLQITLNTNRTGELLDFIANTAGSVIAVFSFNLLHKLSKKVLITIRS